MSGGSYEARSWSTPRRAERRTRWDLERAMGDLATAEPERDAYRQALAQIAAVIEGPEGEASANGDLKRRCRPGADASPLQEQIDAVREIVERALSRDYAKGVADGDAGAGVSG